MQSICQQLMILAGILVLLEGRMRLYGLRSVWEGRKLVAVLVLLEGRMRQYYAI